MLGCTPKEHTAKALGLLEGALATVPNHIAAIHYYIHLVEASDLPQRAEPYADRLRGAAPDADTSCTCPRTSIYASAGTKMCLR